MQRGGPGSKTRDEGAARIFRVFTLPVSTGVSLASAFFLGAISVVGYAPYYMFPLPGVTLAGLFYLWSQARTRRAAVFTGLAFGLGLFLFGVSWVYVSLHDYGAMPAPLATI